MKTVFVMAVAQKYNVNLETEVKFHPSRQWRFDLADKENKIAVEIEGGIWTRGAHGRGTGIMRDIEKYNAAQSLGWRVYRTTPKAFSNVRELGKLLADFDNFLNPKTNEQQDISVGNTVYARIRNKTIKKIVGRSKK